MKLNRTDLTRLLAMTMKAEAEAEVERADAEVRRLAAEFRAAAVERAAKLWARGLEAVAEMTGKPLHGTCTYRLYEDTSPASSACVIFSDGEKAYEGDVRIVVHVPVLTRQLIALREQWEQALATWSRAHSRDLRIGALSKDVRDEIIKVALSSDCGAELLAAAKKVVANIKVPNVEEQKEG